MIDDPERIWSIGSEGPYRISCSILDHSDEPGCTEYVRADLVADKADAWDVISAKNAEIARLQEQVETLRKERDANHRMAVANGQRAKDEHYRAEAAEAERDRLREMLLRAADQCDKWVKETYDGSWSTHQVQSQRTLAKSLRLAALQKEPKS